MAPAIMILFMGQHSLSGKGNHKLGLSQTIMIFINLVKSAFLRGIVCMDHLVSWLLQIRRE